MHFDIIKRSSNHSPFRLAAAAVLALLLYLPVSLQASTPVPFHAEYEATFSGVRAEAQMTFQVLPDDRFQYSSNVELRLLGIRVSSVNETSILTIRNDILSPLRYTFEQSGVGERSRAALFNWDEGQATATVNGAAQVLPLSGEVHDEVSVYLEIQRQLAEGKTDIHMNVLDRDQIEEQHFRVAGEMVVETPLGLFNSVKVERIREDSLRVTEMWFATDWDYLLLKLFQQDPDDRAFEINVSAATVDGNPIVALGRQ